MTDAPKWMLKRGRNDPMIWPFDSREDAEEWALDHGCMDWRAELIADRDEHESACGRCRTPWPCEHVRLDRQARQIILAAENACARCGKCVGWMEVRVKGGGLLGEDIKFHGRQGACRKEGIRRLKALDTDDARAELARIDQEAAYAREHRESVERYKRREREALRESLNAEAENA